MDYIGNKCLVCDKYFHANEDIVVCPQCGTPHHRECFKSTGHCVNHDKHASGYDYQEDISGQVNSDSDDENLILCKKCGAKNASNAFFCTKCAQPLQEIKDSTTSFTGQQVHTHQTQGQPTPPYGNNPQVIMYDPLGGVNPNADLGDDVKVSQAAKYVKQSTPYFMTLFSNIYNYSKSRFNFCAAIFGGGYLLYRKMYKIGTIITAIEVAIMIFTTYLAQYISNSADFSKFLEAYTSYDLDAATMHFLSLSTYDMAMFFVYMLLGLISLILSVVIGACANRMYFNHCKKQIIKIKTNVENPADVDTQLTKKGGVNVYLAISLWISYIILSYLPNFFY